MYDFQQTAHLLNATQRTSAQGCIVYSTVSNATLNLGVFVLENTPTTEGDVVFGGENWKKRWKTEENAKDEEW